MGKDELYRKYKSDPNGLEEYLEGIGYTMLGWQKHTGNCDELKKCHEAGHNGKVIEDKDDVFGSRVINKKTFDIQHNQRGSDVTYWCEECKIYWKIDMSD
jgi:DUF2075 family protein